MALRSVRKKKKKVATLMGPGMWGSVPPPMSTHGTPLWLHLRELELRLRMREKIVLEYMYIQLHERIDKKYIFLIFFVYFSFFNDASMN